MLVRNESRGAKAVDEVRSDVRGAAISVSVCDVSSLVDVRRFVVEFRSDVGSLPRR